MQFHDNSDETSLCLWCWFIENHIVSHKSSPEAENTWWSILIVHIHITQPFNHARVARFQGFCQGQDAFASKCSAMLILIAQPLRLRLPPPFSAFICIAVAILMPVLWLVSHPYGLRRDYKHKRRCLLPRLPLFEHSVSTSATTDARHDSAYLVWPRYLPDTRTAPF